MEKSFYPASGAAIARISRSNRRPPSGRSAQRTRTITRPLPREVSFRACLKNETCDCFDPIALAWLPGLRAVSILPVTPAISGVTTRDFRLQYHSVIYIGRWRMAATWIWVAVKPEPAARRTVSVTVRSVSMPRLFPAVADTLCGLAMAAAGLRCIR